jgi:hypothetical protein
MKKGEKEERRKGGKEERINTENIEDTVKNQPAPKELPFARWSSMTISSATG